MTQTKNAPRGKQNKGTARKQPEKKPAPGFSASAVLRRFILLAIVLGALFWGWSRLYAFGVDLISGILSTLGLGIILVLLAVGALVWLVWRGFSPFIHHWNWWLGGIVFAFGIWGLLAFFRPSTDIMSQVTFGGNVGQSILSTPDILGALRLAALFFITALLITPKGTFRALRGLAKSLWQALRGSYQLVRRLASRPRKQPSHPAAPPRTIKETPISSNITAEAPQATEEVWKKYQEVHSIPTESGWQLPSIDILDKTAEIEWVEADSGKRAKLIEEALASYGVEAKVVQVNAGPSVTQFGVEPGWDRKYKEVKERDREGNVKSRLEEVSKTRVKVDRITSLANDLALALAAPSIRIEAPVPGKSVVGIEVPNTTLGLVSLRNAIESPPFQRIKARSKMALALGKGAGGEAMAADLCRMPHLLIAGATGSGKTVCLNSIICCLLSHNTPDDIQFIMLDPKRVELVAFNSIPHLVAPVVVDTDKAVGTLRWLSQEMDNRYHTLAQAGARNIEDYNRKRRGEEMLPYLVLIVDELADLMMAASDEVERSLCRLAQLARATGIHLVVATQRPSVDVITGLIKANFPTRISFAVTSQVDSRTILDAIGAEKLLGRGDMLYMPTDAAKPKRLQGCLVSDAEIERLVYFWGSQKRQDRPSPKVEDLAQLPPDGRTFLEDPLLEAARKLSREHKHISVSFLQRRLHIGYPRAARLVEMLEEEQSAGEPTIPERK